MRVWKILCIVFLLVTLALATALVVQARRHDRIVRQFAAYVDHVKAGAGAPVRLAYCRNIDGSTANIDVDGCIDQAFERVCALRGSGWEARGDKCGE